MEGSTWAKQIVYWTAAAGEVRTWSRDKRSSSRTGGTTTVFSGFAGASRLPELKLR